MKLGIPDGRRLSGRWLLSLGLLGLALVVVLGSLAWRSQMERAARDAEELLATLQDEARETREAIRIIADHGAAFRRLRAEGFIGPERRLVWIEAVREAGDRAGVLGLKFQVSARMPSARASLPGNGLALYVTRMQLRMDLAHEGDLVDFLDLLAVRGQGFFEVSRCRLNRVNDTGEVRVDGPNLTAECLLDWYSLDTPPAPAEDEEMLL